MSEQNTEFEKEFIIENGFSILSISGISPKLTLWGIDLNHPLRVEVPYNKFYRQQLQHIN